jgi:hypothetical protein
MPSFDLKLLKAVYFDDKNYNTWNKIWNCYIENVSLIDFDIAIIGNGSWGLPLGNYIKMELQKKSIHLGGATQLLFGIMGNRWYKDYPFIKNLMNEHWIFPDLKNTPNWAENYDNKAYW